jgi:hypothetical protein
MMYYDGVNDAEGVATNCYFPVGFEIWNFQNQDTRDLYYVYPVGTGVKQKGQPTGSSGDEDPDLTLLQPWNGYHDGWVNPMPWSDVFYDGKPFWL